MNKNKSHRDEVMVEIVLCQQIKSRSDGVLEQLKKRAWIIMINGPITVPTGLLYSGDLRLYHNNVPLALGRLIMLVGGQEMLLKRESLNNTLNHIIKG